MLLVIKNQSFHLHGTLLSKTSTALTAVTLSNYALSLSNCNQANKNPFESNLLAWLAALTLCLAERGLMHF